MNESEKKLRILREMDNDKQLSLREKAVLGLIVRWGSFVDDERNGEGFKISLGREKGCGAVGIHKDTFGKIVSELVRKRVLVISKKGGMFSEGPRASQYFVSCREDLFTKRKPKEKTTVVKKPLTRKQWDKRPEVAKKLKEAEELDKELSALLKIKNPNSIQKRRIKNKTRELELIEERYENTFQTYLKKFSRTL